MADELAVCREGGWGESCEFSSSIWPTALFKLGREEAEGGGVRAHELNLWMADV